MQKIPCHTFHYRITRHSSIKQNYRNKTFSSNWNRSNHVSHRKKNRSEKKSCILVFTCSLTRAIHLELLADPTTDGFIRALKRLIARKGCPETIYLDNAKTYVAASKLIKKIKILEILHHLFRTRFAKWKFSLCRVPWWDGNIERIIGLVKIYCIRQLDSLYKLQ